MEVGSIMAKVDFTYKCNGFFVSDAVVDRHLRGLTGDEVKALLFLLKKGGEYTPAEAVSVTGLSADCFASCLEGLEKAGLLGGAKGFLASEEHPKYKGEDISLAFQSDKRLGWLLNRVQGKLQKVLNQNEVASLFSITDWLGLEPEAVDLLVDYCIEVYRKNPNNAEKFPTIRYIEKTAMAFANEGRVSAEEIDSYLADYRERSKNENKITALLGISGRKLSSSEQKYIEEWVKAGIALDLIERAYDETVLHTGGLKYPYMNKVLLTMTEQGGAPSPRKIISDIGESFKRAAEKASGIAAPSAKPASDSPSDRRRKNEEELSRRKLELFGTLPKLEELELSMKALGAQIAMAAMGRGENAVTKLKKELDSLKKDRAALLKSAGYSPDYLDPIYTCQKCKDTGSAEKGPCDCVK